MSHLYIPILHNFIHFPSRKTLLQIIALIAIVISSVILEAMSQVRDEACETLQTEIHVTKEEFDELSRLIRTCSGDISVNKCEGGCNSNVQPSVVTPNGFLKECYCCRESFLKERIITLTHCYDPDGVRLTSEKLAEMEVKVKEPANCKCYKCGNNPV